jgi:acyl-CoA reductase-like NAD-dependent aldehyde dehydrogenase
MTIVRDSFYINGEWVEARSSETIEVTTSGTGEVFATVPAGTVEEANLAVEAAAAAFTGWANTSPKERGEYLTRISEKLAERDDEIALVIANEVGMPLMLAKGIQVGLQRWRLPRTGHERRSSNGKRSSETLRSCASPPE